MELVAQERRNNSRYGEEVERMTRAFTEGCHVPGFQATIIEPFMPKQETARGLALAPEAFLSQRPVCPDSRVAEGGWPAHSAYRLDDRGVVCQTMTDDYRELVEGSFHALRAVFGDDEPFLIFLSSLFDPPEGEDRYNVSAYYDKVWAQCLRHNPEPMLPGQPLPPRNTIAGRFVEMLIAMNRMMKTV